MTKIGELFNGPTPSASIGGAIGTIFGTLILVLVENRTGIFRIIKGTSNYSASPTWLLLATSITVCLFLSLLSFVSIYFSTKKYFREDFAFAAISATYWLGLGLFLSLIGRLMFWHPFIAIFYLLAGKSIPLSEPAFSEYVIVILLTIIFYNFAKNRYKNWDGMKSENQYVREQGNDDRGMFIDYLETINRIFFSGNLLKEHLAVDHNRSSSQLEQSEDFVSQAWEEQSRELIVLSSPSYVIDVETGWHARQGYWVGKDKRTGDLFFLYPAFSILTTKDLNTFLQHSKEFSESKKCKTSELIVAFRKNEDKVVSPIDSYPQIRFETEQDLLTELIDFTNYIEDIKKQVLTQNLPESLLTLNDVYVPSKLFSSNQQHGHIDNVEDHIVKWIDEPGQRQIALLGEYGQGKSSTALMLTYNLLCISNQLPRRIPIMIELRGKSPRNLNELEFLASWAVKYKIEPHALMRLHIAGRLILIFEGFDEMALIGNSELRLKHFKVLWRFCYQKAKIIITGRPNFFLDDQEMKATLGIIDATSNSPYCEEIRLAPFTIDMIRTALRNQKTSVRDQICLLAEKETRFLDLVSRPSLLHVVATLWERENLYKNPDRLNSAYVMQLFVRNSYRRQGVKEQDSKGFMALNSSERDYFMCGIAAYMAAKQLSNQITKEQLSELVEKLIEVIPISISTLSSGIHNEERRALKDRIQNSKDVEHINNDVRTCGLLVEDLSSSGTFKFGHKSFMEYLFASVVKEYIWNDNSEKSKAIRKATFFQVDCILELPVSAGFLAEMIGTDNTIKKTKNHIKKTDFQLESAIALRLLRVIFNAGITNLNIRILPLVRILSLLSAVFNVSITRSRSIIMIWIFGLFILSSFLMLPYTFSKPTTIISSYAFYTFFRPISISLLFIILLLYIQYTIMFTGNMSSTFRKLHLWNSICIQIKIDGWVLHKIAGTWIIPKARKKPFTYFLPKTKKNA